MGPEILHRVFRPDTPFHFGPSSGPADKRAWVLPPFALGCMCRRSINSVLPSNHSKIPASLFSLPSQAISRPAWESALFLPENHIMLVIDLYLPSWCMSGVISFDMHTKFYVMWLSHFFEVTTTWGDVNLITPYKTWKAVICTHKNTHTR